MCQQQPARCGDKAEHPRVTEPSLPAETARKPRLRILIPLVVGCAFFMEGLDSTMLAVAIPDMARSLGENPLRLNLVITTYLLSLAVFIPVSGWIADRLGTRALCFAPQSRSLRRDRCCADCRPASR